MVDWQFTIFCRKVGFVEIYAFLANFFLAKNVSLLFLSLFASLLWQSAQGDPILLSDDLQVID